MMIAAPQWKRVFLIVFYLFGQDLKQQEAAHQEAKEAAAARRELEKDAESIRRWGREGQRDSYYRKVGWWLYQLSAMRWFATD